MRTGQEGPELEPGVVEEEGGAADSVLGNIVDAIKAPANVNIVCVCHTT